MVKCKCLLLFVGFISACGNIVIEAETVSETTSSTISTSSESTASTSLETTSSSSTSTSLPGNNVCIGIPYAHPDGMGFETWASPDCTGDFASVNLLQGFPCVQWPSGDTYCVDVNQPVADMFYHNTNNNGICEKWTESTWPWYVWEFCGNKPLPQ